jgi:hypothetical protein
LLFRTMKFVVVLLARYSVTSASEAISCNSCYPILPYAKVQR